MTPLALALLVSAQPPLPVYPVPVPVFAPPLLPAPLPPPVRPLTIQEFGKLFVPTPGFHVVCLIHPVTCKPVTVAFTLPAGCGCPKVKVQRREVEFDYGRREVELRFRRNGAVDVENR